MSAALARAFLFLGRIRRDYHHAAVFDAALGDDVIGEMLHLSAGATQCGDFHAIIIVEVDMQRRQREVMVAVIIFDQASRQVTRGMIVDVDQRGDAFA